MPIFSKKFDIKTIPQRAKRYTNCPQIQEKLDDIQVIQINLNSKRIIFDNGIWDLCQPGAEPSDIGNVKKRIQKLEEENNLKQIKVDILLDMVAENLAELNILRGK